jgi:hypothetical protein
METSHRAWKICRGDTSKPIINLRVANQIPAESPQCVRDAEFARINNVLVIA